MQRNGNSLIHELRCSITGVPLGFLNLTVSGGHMPYLSHWNEQICHHPYFSIPQAKLLTLMRDEWNRLAKGVIDGNISEIESTNLRVGFVAILHSLGSIKQDKGTLVLPEIGIVQSNLESLTALAFWQHYLESKRFAFPYLHISRTNNNFDLSGISDYLEACWEKKREYESGMDDIKEKEKLRVTEKAILAIRNSFNKPASKKVLWRWVRGHLPQKWQPDAEGWMGTIFLGSNAVAMEFEEEDINLLEEIIISECPIGNSVMYSVRERLNEIKKAYNEHYDTFTIEEEGLAFIEGIKNEVSSSPEPQRSDFPHGSSGNAQFFVAQAKWRLANPVSQPAKVIQAIESAKAKLNVKAEDL